MRLFSLVSRINGNVMAKKLHQLFQNIAEINPPLQLERAILARIEAIKARRVRRQLVLSYAGLAGSVLAIFYTFFTFGLTLVKSDFWSLITLLFSDAGVVARDWNNYAFSLLENFPSLSFAAILLPVFLLMLSINSYLNINNKHKYI